MITKPTNLGQSTLILGKPGSGKSTRAFSLLDAADRVLYFRLANTPIDLIPAEADVVMAASWDELLQDYRKATKDSKYDAIVIDGLQVLLSMAIQRITDDQPSQKQWGEISRMVWSEVLQIQRHAKVFVATLEVKPDEEGNPQAALNRDTYTRLLPHFTNKEYCSMEADFVDGSPVEGTARYYVESNPMIALAFMRSVSAPIE